MSDRGMSKHGSNSVFNELRLAGNFCDGAIKVGDVEFQIHKVILCKCSPYFRALFSRWSTSERKLYEIPGVSPVSMQLIIEFAYIGSTTVTEDNVQELMLAADQLNVTDLVQDCCNFLVKHLSLENCIGIWQFTNTCFSYELQQRALRLILDHFEEIVSCDEFQLLTAQELTEILDRDDLNVRKESIVFEAILHWINYAPAEREEHMAILLSKVRLALTSVNYISVYVMSSELVKTRNDCYQIASEAIQTIYRSSRHSPTVASNRLARPRLPNAILLAIGGWSGGDPTNAIEAYDVRTDRWINVSNNLEHPRAYHGTAVLNGYVYCVGGFNRVEHFNSVRKFDLSTRTWHEAAPMHYRRCYVSVTVLNGLIYAMGGYNGHTRLSSAERYRSETNQWTLIAPMHEQRSDACSTTLQNKIYICGGFNGNDCLQTCEYYNPDTNQWTMIPSMRTPRSGIGVIAYADCVFAVGGFDGNNRLNSVEAYNPETNTWSLVPCMSTTRSNFGIEVMEDLLFVVGGFNGFTTSNNVEYYDIVRNEWIEACDMEIFRSALTCCVVSELTILASYTVPRDNLPLLQLGDVSMESEDSI